MALTYVGGTSGVGTGASYTVSLSGTLTGGSNSSPSAGDIVVVFAGHGNTATSAPAVSGNNNGSYTVAGSTTYSNDTWDTNFGAFYKVQGGTVDTSLTITRTNNTTYGGATTVHVWRGVNAGNPMAATPVKVSASNQSSCVINPGAINPTGVTGAVIIAGGSGTMAATSSAYTGFTGMSNFVTNKGDGSTSDTGTAMASYDYAGVSYDPPTVSGGTTSTSSSWGSCTLALRPAVDYALTCSSGSYTYTGSSVTITKAAAPANDYAITCSSGSYAVTGSSATVARNRALTSNSGSYSYTGSSVTASRNRALSASGGAYTIAGASAVIERDRVLTAQGGSYTYSGQQVTITYTPNATGYELIAQAGSYALTGQNAVLSRNRVLSANGGEYTLAGVNAVIERDRLLTAESGAYALTGQDVTITHTVPGAYVLTALGGAYTITGGSAVISHGTAEEPAKGGAVSRSNRPKRRVVVEVDGKEYVVPVEGLQEFLDAISKKAEAVAQVPKKRKTRKQNVSDTKDVSAPVVKVVSAPVEEIALIQRHVDRTNEIMRQVWQSAMQRYLQEIEDEEEWLLMLL